MAEKKGKEKKEDALAVKEPSGGLSHPMTQMLSEEQRKLIKRNFAKNATDDELSIYFNFCQKAGVDPLRGQAHFIKYEVGGKPIMMIGIDGFQARATSDPRYEGMVANVVRKNDDFSMNAIDGTIAHSFGAKDRGEIVGAYALLKRKGMINAIQWVRFEEYSKPSQTNWKSMPEVMITKVARATLLRREYPDNFSGVYVPEEFNAEITEKGDFIDHSKSEPAYVKPFPEGQPIQETEFKEESEPEPEKESGTIIPPDTIEKGMTPREALKAIMDYSMNHEIGSKVRPIICKHFGAWEDGDVNIWNIPENNVIAIVEELTGIKLKKAEKAKKCQECSEKITEPEAEEQDGLCLKCFTKKQESED